MTQTSSDRIDDLIDEGIDPSVALGEYIDHLSRGERAPDRLCEAVDPVAGRAAEELAAELWQIDFPPDDHVRDRAISAAIDQWGVRPRYRVRGRLWKVSLLGVALTIAIGAMFVYRAQASLPGDRLWQVKRWTEGFRQWVARGDVAETEAALRNTGERLRETERLLDKGQIGLAKAAIFEFYRQSEEVRLRLRALSRERHSKIFEEADRQAALAVDLDRRISGEDVQREKPISPVVGTRSPTPRPPGVPAVAEEPTPREPGQSPSRPLPTAPIPGAAR